MKSYKTPKKKLSFDVLKFWQKALLIKLKKYSYFIQGLLKKGVRASLDQSIITSHGRYGL